MKAAKLSYWNNKWTDIFDFTPNKGGKPNHRLDFSRQLQFVVPLAQMQRIIQAAEKSLGGEITSLKCKKLFIKDHTEIGEHDLENIQLDFEEE